MWSANEADGKINTLLEMKNDCFMVCRDSKI